MADSDDLDDAILDLAGKPKKVQSGDKSIEQQSIADLIEAAKHLKQVESTSGSASKPGFGLRFQQITPVYR